MIRANILRRGLTRALSGKAPAAPVPAVLPDLPYAYGALEPAISGTIMEVHHTKHHAAWVDVEGQEADFTKNCLISRLSRAPWEF
jgi:hypothetical protein